MDKLLKEIEENRTKFRKLFNKKNNLFVLYKWLKNELTYTSNAIEGNTLTRKETRLVIDEGITSSSKPLRNYIEAINHAKAFEKTVELIKENKDIDENFMLGIHKIILSGLYDDNAGFYRNCRVRISGSNVIMPNPIKVPDLMNEFYNWLKNNLEDEPMCAILAHIKFVSIHPHVDGNGRCARLLMNAILLKNAYAPIIVKKSDRKKYLSAIELYQLKGDIEPYKKLMLTLLNRTFKMLISMLDDKNTSDKELLTISKYAKYKGVRVSTIRYKVKTGEIIPNSYTDSGYMLFAKD